jgi:hypothetical protein
MYQCMLEIRAGAGIEKSNCVQRGLVCQWDSASIIHPVMISGKSVSPVRIRPKRQSLAPKAHGAQGVGGLSVSECLYSRWKVETPEPTQALVEKLPCFGRAAGYLHMSVTEVMPKR